MKDLASSREGLSSEEASGRLKKHGHNEIKFKRRGPVLRLLAQFNNPLLIVLIIAALACLILWLFMGEEEIVLDMWVIIGVVIATAIIGFVQEGKAESAINALRDMMVHKCSVRREGSRKEIPARDLVPGDIVILETGDKVPSDLRLLSSSNLYVDESMLTGESMPVPKDIKETGDELFNIAFSGTFVTGGRGEGVVFATGEDTELGKIAGMIKSSAQTKPPIMKKISSFVKVLIATIIAFGLLMFLFGVFLWNYDAVYMFLAMIGIMVAMMPEGLAGAVIAAFAMGSTFMARKNAIVRNLPAAETLGSVTVICSDKTGTLTRNEMTVQRIFSGMRNYTVEGIGYEPSGNIMDENNAEVKEPAPELERTLLTGYLCNNAGIEKDGDRYVAKGSNTEAALIVSAIKGGCKGDHERIKEIPFEAKYQYMATLNDMDDGKVLLVKGSPERVIEACDSMMVEGRIIPIEKDAIVHAMGEMASDALRVLAFAYKEIPKDRKDIDRKDVSGLVFVGMQGMIDPPRQEALEAITKCGTAGIRTVMITGDHALTASAIARKLSILDDSGKVLTGKDLSEMTDDDLHDVVDEVSVYARVEPEHKFRITKQLQRKGHIVAMTGDGVNDAPALKAADIGIAMGRSGTEVTKEASDIILTDDNFATIVDAVKEGRHVYDMIWRVILYLLPTNGGQGFAIAGALFLSSFIPVFRESLPIEPVQILWVNLVIAIACAIPLIWEPPEKGLLNRPPRDPKERLFNRFFMIRVGMVSLIEVVMIFIMFLTFYRMNGNESSLLPQAQTLAFTTIIMIEVGYLFTARSLKDSAFRINPFRNRWLILGAALTIALQLLLIYSGPLFGISPFRTEPFPAIWWIPLVVVSTSSFFAVEAEKLIRRRLARKGE